MNRKIIRGVKKSAVGTGHTIESLESEPSATMEAESTLQSLLSSLSNPSFNLEDLPNLMRAYLLSLRLLGIDDEWASMELKGYKGSEKLSAYRKTFCDTEYIGTKSGEIIESTRKIYEYTYPLIFIASRIEPGWKVESDGPTKKLAGRRVSTKKTVHMRSWEIKIVLEQIAEELFDRASKTLVTAKFGSAIDTIFRDYQKAVSSVLSNLDIQDHLDTAYVNLKGGNEAKWRAAALACRTVLQDISAKLWRVECDDYDIGGKSMSVKSDKPRNRLRAYMHIKGLKKDGTPVALLDPVYAQASAAKIKCSYEDARSVLVVTYLFLAELIRQTDMEPVMEIPKRYSKSKK